MRLIRLKEVINLTGLGRSSIYKFMEEGRFPESISLGERAVAWEISEIEEWISIKIEGRTNIDRVNSKRESVRSPVTEADVTSFIYDKFSGCNVSVAIAWLIEIFKQ